MDILIAVLLFLWVTILALLGFAVLTAPITLPVFFIIRYFKMKKAEKKKTKLEN